jgi:hypothetical protein
MTTMTSADYRIERIQKTNFNGKAVKLFLAYEREGDEFVFVGRFSAPSKTSNKNLWLIAEERGGIRSQ